MFLIKHFVASTIHLGHKTNKWNPRTSYFLLGMRDGIFVIDLEQTLIMMKRALTFIKKICLRRGYIFFIPPVLSDYGKSSKKSLYNGGNLNFSRDNTKFPIKTDVNLIFLSQEYFYSSKQRGMLYALTQKRKSLGLYPMTKNSDSTSIVDLGNCGFDNLNKQNNTYPLTLKNILKSDSRDLFLKPEVLFTLQINKNTALIKEAVKFQIPIIGILDSNSNSYAIQYPIPGNDDSNTAFNLYTELLINTIIEAKKNEAKILLSANNGN